VVDLSSAWAALPGSLLATVRFENAIDTDYELRAAVRAPGQVLTLLVEGRWD
jgi:hypothetical protein